MVRDAIPIVHAIANENLLTYLVLRPIAISVPRYPRQTDGAIRGQGRVAKRRTKHVPCIPIGHREVCIFANKWNWKATSDCSNFFSSADVDSYIALKATASRPTKTPAKELCSR